ncbi:MAG: acyl-CoA-binding protein [Bdellovibrionales bacterium]
MDFKEASERVTQLKKRPDNDTLLKLYGLFKQASEGDVKGQRPGIIDFKGRAKYDAWKSRAGMSTDEARTQYVRLVQDLVARD